MNWYVDGYGGRIEVGLEPLWQDLVSFSPIIKYHIQVMKGSLDHKLPGLRS